jgi:hypothetical protein
MFSTFLFKILKETDHSKGFGVYGRDIKIDVEEIGCEGVDWIHLARGRH